MENTGKPTAPMAGGGAKEKVEKQDNSLMILDIKFVKL